MNNHININRAGIFLPLMAVERYFNIFYNMKIFNHIADL